MTITQLSLKIFGLFLVLLLASCQRAIDTEPWLVYGKAYVRADAVLIQNESDKKHTTLEDLAARKEAEAKLLAVSAPPMEILEKLLRSDDAEIRKSALVNVMLRKIDAKGVLDSILQTYGNDDDMFTKFYSVQSFKELSREKLKIFEDKLVNIMASETSEVVLIAAVPTLAKADPAKVRPLLSRWAQTGSDALRDVSLIFLKKGESERG